MALASLIAADETTGAVPTPPVPKPSLVDWLLAEDDAGLAQQDNLDPESSLLADTIFGNPLIGLS